MTNYEKIKAIIESGHLALCQSNVWYDIFSTIASNWHIRNSTTSLISVEDCLDFIWITSYNENKINNLIFTSIRPYPIKPKVLKEWDMVEILEIAKEIGNYDDWNNKQKEMIWKWPFEIKEIIDSYEWIYYKIYNKDKSDY